MPSKPRILVIDNEPQIHRFLGPALSAAGYQPVRAECGEEGLTLLATRTPAALILDLALPDLEGMKVIERARRFYAGPLLILTARTGETDKIDALDLGADDYIEKPFRIGEFLARLRVAMRNKFERRGVKPLIQAGELEIDLTRHLVLRSGEIVSFSPLEYQLLARLVEAAGRVMTHRQLLTAVWGDKKANNVQYLRVFIQHLREKLEPDPSRPTHILTVSGVGYRFMA